MTILLYIFDIELFIPLHLTRKMPLGLSIFVSIVLIS